MAAPLPPRIYRVELDDTRGGRHNDGDANGAMISQRLGQPHRVGKVQSSKQQSDDPENSAKSKCEELGTGLRTPQATTKMVPPTR